MTQMHRQIVTPVGYRWELEDLNHEAEYEMHDSYQVAHRLVSTVKAGAEGGE